MEKDINNRNLGEIYTPEHISQLLKSETKKVFGDNFEDKFLIWDCAWGTGNLTKVLDGTGELYCSTLRQMDIKKNRKLAGNKFVYNFLEEDIDELFSEQAMWIAEHKNLPNRIVECLENPNDKPILFYINPPYVGTGIFGANNTDFKDNATESKIKLEMKKETLGGASDQLYCQFIYKIWKIMKAYNKKIYMALVIPAQLLTVQSYSRFREEMFKHFKFEHGAYFRANNFKGLNNRWGITIQLWSPGVNTNKNEFTMDLYKNLSQTEIKHIGFKKLYNIDGIEPGNMVAMNKLNTSNETEAPITLSSGVRVSNKRRILWDKDSIGFVFFKGNNVYHNCTEVGIMCKPYSDGSGFSINKDNFDDALAFFTARRSVGVYDRDWTTDKDEYMTPNVDCNAYKKLIANSLIYSLFNDNTHFSGFYFDNKRYYNNFNFLSKEELIDLGFDKDVIEIEYNKSGCNYIVERLKQDINSGLVLNSGLDVIDEVKKLYRYTMNLREKFDKEDGCHIYQVKNWDAGWYQIKWILKKYDNDTYKKFRMLYRIFSREVCELVYEAGFLKNRALDFNGDIIRNYDVDLDEVIDLEDASDESIESILE